MDLWLLGLACLIAYVPTYLFIRTKIHVRAPYLAMFLLAQIIPVALHGKTGDLGYIE